MAGSPGEAERPRFAIFRGKDALAGAEMTCMTYEAVTPIVADGAQRAMAAGADLILTYFAMDMARQGF